MKRRKSLLFNLITFIFILYIFISSSLVIVMALDMSKSNKNDYSGKQPLEPDESIEENNEKKPLDPEVLNLSSLNKSMNKYSDISIYYENIETGYIYRYNADKVYYSASVIKAPFALYVYTLAESGSANLTDTYAYTSHVYRDGTGIIKNMTVGTAFTINELLEYSIRKSDNIAFRMLIEKYGAKEYRQFVEDMGGNTDFLTSVELADMTANEAGLFAKEIYKYIESDSKYSNQFKTDLMSTINPMIISDHPIARKYGWSKKSFHDMAIVYAGSPYILIIMTDHENGTTQDFIMFREISKLIQQLNDEIEIQIN